MSSWHVNVYDLFPAAFSVWVVFLLSLEMLDKVEPPSIPEGYAMSVAFSALLDLVRGITSMMERELNKQEQEAATREEAEPDGPPQEPSECTLTSRWFVCVLEDSALTLLSLQTSLNLSAWSIPGERLCNKKLQCVVIYSTCNALK